MFLSFCGQKHVIWEKNYLYIFVLNWPKKSSELLNRFTLSLIYPHFKGKFQIAVSLQLRD